MRESLRPGLTYKVMYTGNGDYRIGAIIDPSKVVHSGNIHFLPMLYDTPEEAQQDIDHLMEQAAGEES